MIRKRQKRVFRVALIPLLIIAVCILLFNFVFRKEYVNEEAGFKFNYPVCWEVKETLGELELKGTCRFTKALSKIITVEFLKYGKEFNYEQEIKGEDCQNWEENSNWCYRVYSLQPTAHVIPSDYGRMITFITYQHNTVYSITINHEDMFAIKKEVQKDYWIVEKVFFLIVRSFEVF